MKIKGFIVKNDLIAHGDSVLLGVSGGPDSVAMTYLFNVCKYELGIKLYLAHYNHNLRKTSVKDQDFVISLSEKLNLPLITKTGFTNSQKIKGSVEEFARTQRFNFLIQAAQQVNADSIALAHTQDDLSETVLMRIIRGAGLYGLRSILPKRQIHKHTFIRPLLGVTKQEIIAFLKKEKIAYCLDPTNKQTIFFRNKIRHELLPLLKKDFNSNIQETLAHLSETMTSDYDYLQKQAEKAYARISKTTKKYLQIKLETKKIQKLHLALQRLVFRIAITELKGDTNRITLAHILAIESLIQSKPLGSIVNLPNNLSIKKTAAFIIFQKN